MNSNEINIITGSTFPWHIKLLAGMFIIIAFSIIADYPIVSAILSFISILIFTGRSGVEINLNNKNYKEYTSFFFVIKMGKTVKFESMEYLFISAAKMNQKINSARTSTNSTTLKYDEYTSFLKFNESEKVKLWSQRDKKDLLLKTNAISKALKIEVIDRTTSE